MGTIRRPTLRRQIHAVDPKAAAAERRKLAAKDPARRMLKIIPWFGIIPALGVVGIIIWLGIKGLPTWKYCSYFEEEFEGDKLDETKWNYEVNLGGFGNKEFEYTAKDPNNVYVRNGKLYIKPTLAWDPSNQDPISLDKILYGYTLNLTNQGCTGGAAQCVLTSNWTNNTIIPPIKSGRINTKGKVKTKFGKGEIKVRMPTGNWIWPAVWMLPEAEAYGPWPRSGEIDIIESRGNDVNYAYGGRDKMFSALHYGVDPLFRKTESKYINRRHGTLANTWHTIGWEWTPDYFLTWLDSPLRTNLYIPFNTHFYWKNGGFENAYVNKTQLTDPWNSNYNVFNAAPFDQEFFLILNVAVGGTNGFFPDGEKKPWQNADLNAAYNFLTSLTDWYNTTWPEGDDRAMQVEYVKMWKICNLD
ncbi:hypothetical protein HDU76_005896 [Blyttiomyces sp. JEL0837]|nr:hypothetical protein HDU76_005896 [Blyttiomyces sp. JEL0837]